jgi:prolyl oligopeptidase
VAAGRRSAAAPRRHGAAGNVRTMSVFPPSAYPPADRAPIVDDLFGHRVADPYRWLEVETGADTVAWSAAEDEVYASWAAEHPERVLVADRLMDLIPGFRSAPVVIGGRRFWTSRRPGQDHAVLHVTDDAGDRALVDPNLLDPDGKITLDGWSPSIEGDRLAYLLSSGGDEEAHLWVVDVDSGDVLDGPVDRLRYSPLSWLPGGGELVYVRRLAPDLVPEGEAAFHRRVWRHRVGADPAGDVLLFGGEGRGRSVEKTAYLGADVSEDGAWIAVTVGLGTAPRNDLFLARLPAEGPPQEWTAVLEDVDAQAAPAWDRNGQLWVLTDLDAPRRRLVRADPAHAEVAAWQEVLAEDGEGGVLDGYVLAGEHIVALRSRHALATIAVHDRADGSWQRDVEVPGPGSAGLTGRPDEGAEVWVGWTDYTTPYTVLALDPATGTLTGPGPDGAGRAGEGAGSTRPAAHARQVLYRSSDGTEVRMTVIAPTTEPERPRPTILYGYGGFNVPLTPAYSSTVLAWVEAGGVWVVANLRGGSEEGEAWHRDGMREHKHHVFEDFEGAADVLVAAGWTTPEQLGIMGGSNGGLLVGAALTRSPERYRAVVCSAPLLDMVRYERFGLGATWNDEFGSAGDPTELEWLLGYSPYHHVTKGTTYPATLFTLFDGDSRVDTLHGRKMAAQLQWATAAPPAERPILVRREADVGHGARSVRRSVDLAGDELVFLATQLGLALPGAS